jgi:hypothetical protein
MYSIRDTGSVRDGPLVHIGGGMAIHLLYNDFLLKVNHFTYYTWSNSYQALDLFLFLAKYGHRPRIYNIGPCAWRTMYTWNNQHIYKASRETMRLISSNSVPWLLINLSYQGLLVIYMDPYDPSSCLIIYSGVCIQEGFQSLVRKDAS